MKIRILTVDILNSPAVRKLFLLNSYAFDPLVPTAGWVDKLSS